ncbi:MAG: hypothetical protein NVSMB64_18840 [Candidatus Velthaea sp.]
MTTDHEITTVPVPRRIEIVKIPSTRTVRSAVEDMPEYEALLRAYGESQAIRFTDEPGKGLNNKLHRLRAHMRREHNLIVRSSYDKSRGNVTVWCVAAPLPQTRTE